MVVREGAKLRGFPGVTLDTLRNAPILAPDGALLYHTGLQVEPGGPGTDGYAFLRAPFRRRPRPLVWPGSPGRDVSSIHGLVYNAKISSTAVAFMAPAAPGRLELDTLYVWDGNEGPRAVARIGDEVAPFESIWDLRWSAPGPSGLPAMVVETLRRNAELHWTLEVPDADGRYVVRARSYESPPAGPAGSRLTLPGHPWQNARGDVAIKAGMTLANPEPGRSGSTVIWVLRANGTAEVAARIGDPAPGAPPGAVFAYFDLLDFSDRGVALIGASIQGDGVGDMDNSGTWVHDPTTGLRLIFRKGDALSCLPDHDAYWVGEGVAMNAAGLVVLAIEWPDGAALVAFPPDGECVPLVKEGDPVRVGRRRVKILRDFAVTGSLYGGRFLNDAGELVFTARFEDGTEAVLVTAPIAPAPAE